MRFDVEGMQMWKVSTDVSTVSLGHVAGVFLKDKIIPTQVCLYLQELCDTTEFVWCGFPNERVDLPVLVLHSHQVLHSNPCQLLNRIMRVVTQCSQNVYIHDCNAIIVLNVRNSKELRRSTHNLCEDLLVTLLSMPKTNMRFFDLISKVY